MNERPDVPGPLNAPGKLLAVLGAVLLLVGILLSVAPRIPFLGRLPGDVHLKLGETRIIVPLTTCIIVSIILTILVNLLLRWFK
jgi:uncharacterized protein HemY